ncbi:MAG: hypothetical protein JNJ75_06445 [Cyclobacteriaceae bacterium]|nr:hypothetical protein [Cyclobacteriaceae bacterium]
MHKFTFFLMLVGCISCGGQTTRDFSHETLESVTSDTITVPGSAGSYYTQFQYNYAGGKRLTIQNSFPRGEQYFDPQGNRYAKTIFWTRIINQTDNPLHVTIDFSGDTYAFPNYIRSPQLAQHHILIPPDTLMAGAERLGNYGFHDAESFLAERLHKPSSLKRTINPNQSTGFYVVRLLLVTPEVVPPRVKGGPKLHTRAGFTLKGQDLFYTFNGKEIQCGTIK